MDKRKVALITGVTGQDGSYLAELLLEKGYEVPVLKGVHLRLILKGWTISSRIHILKIITFTSITVIYQIQVI